jgi:MerR family transcriptional regulator, copper efflux regulator
MTHFSTGQLAKAAGVHIETIRYYERKGLIPSPERRASGYRQFPEETVHRIRFIRRAKDLGFSLAEIGELLALRLDPDSSCHSIKERAEEKIAGIEEKIEALERMRQVLSDLTAACDGKGTVRHCEILKAMEDPTRSPENS